MPPVHHNTMKGTKWFWIGLDTVDTTNYEDLRIGSRIRKLPAHSIRKQIANSNCKVTHGKLRGRSSVLNYWQNSNILALGCTWQKNKQECA